MQLPPPPPHSNIQQKWTKVLTRLHRDTVFKFLVWLKMAHVHNYEMSWRVRNIEFQGHDLIKDQIVLRTTIFLNLDSLGALMENYLYSESFNKFKNLMKTEFRGLNVYEVHLRSYGDHWPYTLHFLRRRKRNSTQPTAYTKFNSNREFLSEFYGHFQGHKKNV